ncbi:lysophospholipase family protein [Aspergillus affinis]|uniref:lysophospholipase family protein n=1 Tax=Aspergillus affinis TaxID=1070780 RepID=UPI0022FF001D|nr:lysophospholipase Plb1 [Aspergillus affinis]KAI9042613.1 lysophospholipase Plb1 [Aspergillus affinis]
MKASTAVVALAGLLSGATAAPENIYGEELMVRALPNAPAGYKPTSVSCPASRPTIRSAAKLSPNESDWLETRRGKTKSALKDFFGHVTIKDFDAAGYIDRVSSNSSNLPNIGIAVSGGGYRALMNGAGAIKAFDSRTENSTSSGQLGGLLQSATYVAGLSGGSWLVGSIFVNNYTTISDLQTTEKGSVWQFQNSIFEGPDGGSIQILDSASYYKDIHDAVSQKKDAGFNASITDYWGRALSYQLVNATNGGPSYTWSSIAETEAFKNADMPMPLVVADGRNPGELLVSSNATVYEFTPWEFGTFDPTVFGFAPLEYLGSAFDGGSLPKDEKCIRGFDNAGFVMGSSSTLFNQFLLQVNSTSLPGFLKSAFTDILEEIGQDEEDIALYTPNPFYHWSNKTSPVANTKELDIVDGGEDLQNIPVHPLIQPERHVDVIFAVDSSADTDYSWPNGTALVATYERSLNSSGIANGTAFPAVPGQDTFVNNGLNTRPTFFGCNSTNATGTGPAPLIVYLPNYPYVSYSNMSTFDPSYEESVRDNTILNGYHVATMANSTRDGNWSTCVGCAILSRSFERTNTKVPDICNQCFDRYCWDGSINTTKPADYEPQALLGAGTTLSPAFFTSLFAAGLTVFALL